MYLVIEVLQVRADWLQDVHRRNCVRVLLEPVCEESRVEGVVLDHSEHELKVRRRDDRRDRTVPVLLTQKHLKP